MYIFDTNVVSELRKAASGRADANVLAWTGSIAPPLCYVSAMSMLEMEIGVRRMERRDPVQGHLLREWLSGVVLPFFSGRVLPVDLAVAMRCGEFMVPDPKPDRDALIGATASVHNMVLVTRNVGDFAGMDIKLLNPWAG